MTTETLINEIMNNEALINAIENLTLKEFNTLPTTIKIRFYERSIVNAMQEATKDLRRGDVESAKEWIEKAESFSKEIKAEFHNPSFDEIEW